MAITTPTYVTERHRDDLPNPILPEFWVRPADAIAADLAMLRAAGPVYLPEPEIPLEPGQEHTARELLNTWDRRRLTIWPAIRSA